MAARCRTDPELDRCSIHQGAARSDQHGRRRDVAAGDELELVDVLPDRPLVAVELVSLWTVMTNLSHIFLKLEVTNRTELTCVVLEHDQPPHRSLH